MNSRTQGMNIRCKNANFFIDGKMKYWYSIYLLLMEELGTGAR